MNKTNFQISNDRSRAPLQHQLFTHGIVSVTQRVVTRPEGEGISSKVTVPNRVRC